jgi:hypothetical protein
MLLLFFVRYKHQISLVNYAKPNQNVEVVHYNREFVITVIVKTEFDCSQNNANEIGKITSHRYCKICRFHFV